LGEEELRILKEINREVDGVFAFAVAKVSVDAVQSYLGRGRCFKPLNEDGLTAKYVQIMQQWSLVPTDLPTRQMVSDIYAEYELRGTEPPTSLVKGEAKAIKDAISAVIIENLSAERKEEIGSEFFADYENAKKEHH
jgi:hypothetical protein